MKITTTFLFLFIGLISFGQGLNAELSFNDDYNQTAEELVVVDEYTYFVEYRDKSNSFFSFNILHKIDTLGQIIWSRPLEPQFAEIIRTYELIPSENNGVYLLGFGMPTCDVVNDCFWFIQKYNSNGTAEWTKSFEDINCYEVEVSGLALTENNELLVNHSNEIESKIYTLNTGGTLIDSLSIPHQELNAINTLSSYENVAYKKDSLLAYDQNGNIAHLIKMNSYIQGIEVLNDTLYTLTPDSVFIFDHQLQKIQGEKIAGYGNYKHLKVNNNSIEFIAQEANNLYILTVDRQLSLVDVLTISSAISSGAKIDFNDLHLTAAIDFPLTQFFAVRYLDYSRHSTQNVPVNTTDIGIVDMKTTQITTTLFDTPSVYHVEISGEVLLKNYGNKVLNNCRINHNLGMNAACGYRYYIEQFSNLNLAPNDSMWVSLGLFHSKTNYFTGDSIAPQICVYTSHPNFKTDLSVSNDQYCKSIFAGYVDLQDEHKSTIKIYPNPVQNVLHIESTTNDLQYVIFNTQGKEIIKNTVQSKQININELAKGMYLLHLTSKNGEFHYQKRIVKQ